MKIKTDLIQGTKEWHEAKLGKITGTVLKDIMGTPKKREDTLYEIVGERLTPEIDMEYLYESPLNRGNRLEDEARKAFEYVTGKKVTQVGMCINKDHPDIAYSPDGLIIEESADIEIKCPEGKNYMKIVLNNAVPDEYHYQIIQGFVVNPDLKKRYFVAYNPDIKSYPIHIIEVTRESLLEEINEALEKQVKFIQEVDDTLTKINYV